MFVLKVKDMFGRILIDFGLLEKARTGRNQFLKPTGVWSPIYFVKKVKMQKISKFNLMLIC